jgi:hypothetical protein
MINFPRQAGAPRYQTLPRMPAATVERRSTKYLHHGGRFPGRYDPSFLHFIEKARDSIASSSDQAKRPIARQGETNGAPRPRAITKSNRAPHLPTNQVSRYRATENAGPEGVKARKPEQEARARMPRQEPTTKTDRVGTNQGGAPISRSRGAEERRMPTRGVAGNWFGFVGVVKLIPRGGVQEAQ